jgi:hypothetical protein
MSVEALKKCVYITTILGLTLGLSGCMEALADTEDVLTRSFEVREGGTLTMDVHGASIKVNTGKGNAVKVEVIRTAKTSNESKAKDIFAGYEIEFNHSGKDVTVEAEYHGGRSIFPGMGRYLRVRFIVTVPQTYNLDVKTSGGSISVDEIAGDVKAKTSGGSLKFARVKGPLWARTSGGSISLEGCEGNADVKTSGGSIRIGKVHGEVTAITSGGSIKVKEVMGTINAGTSGGSVSASISKQPEGDCRLTTSGGSVTVRLAEDIKVDVDAKTSGGKVSTDFPVTMQGVVGKRHLKAEINGGGPELYLRTSGGSIHIDKL